MFWVIPTIALGSSLLADDGVERKNDLGPSGRRFAKREHRFKFIGACTDMTGAFVNYVRDDRDKEREICTRQITYTTFARACDLDELRLRGHPAMYKLSTLYGTSFHKAQLPSGALCYYFVWSAIEHFFVEEPERFDLERETAIVNEKEDKARLLFLRENGGSFDGEVMPLDSAIRISVQEMYARIQSFSGDELSDYDLDEKYDVEEQSRHLTQQYPDPKAKTLRIVMLFSNKPGLGTKLYQQAEEMARKHNVKYMVACSADLGAGYKQGSSPLAFWKKMGFSVELDDESPESEAVIVKRLT